MLHPYCAVHTVRYNFHRHSVIHHTQYTPSNSGTSNIAIARIEKAYDISSENCRKEYIRSKTHSKHIQHQRTSPMPPRTFNQFYCDHLWGDGHCTRAPKQFVPFYTVTLCKRDILLCGRGSPSNFTIVQTHIHQWDVRECS